LYTVLKIAVPKKAEIYVGPQLYLPTESPLGTPGIGPGAIFINKSHTKAYNIGWDVVNKQVQVGILFKL